MLYFLSVLSQKSYTYYFKNPFCSKSLNFKDFKGNEMTNGLVLIMWKKNNKENQNPISKNSITMEVGKEELEWGRQTLKNYQDKIF